MCSHEKMYPWVTIKYQKLAYVKTQFPLFLPVLQHWLIPPCLKRQGEMYCAPTMIFFMHLSFNWILLIKHWDWTLSAFYRRDKLRIRVVKKYEYLKSCGWHAILGISKSKNYFDSTNINKPFKSTEVMGTIKRTFEEALTSRGF